MARSVNKVIIVGNLGQEPELKSTPQGKSVCSLRIATSESYLDKVSNEWKENTDWHTIILWERLAERAGQYLKKGSKVYIEGSLKHRSYEGKDGVTRYVTEVLGRELILLDKSESGSSSYSSNYSQSPSKSYEVSAPDYVNEEPDDDEVPF